MKVFLFGHDKVMCRFSAAWYIYICLWQKRQMDGQLFNAGVDPPGTAKYGPWPTLAGDGPSLGVRSTVLSCPDKKRSYMNLLCVRISFLSAAGSHLWFRCTGCVGSFRLKITARLCMEWFQRNVRFILHYACHFVQCTGCADWLNTLISAVVRCESKCMNKFKNLLDKDPNSS